MQHKPFYLFGTVATLTVASLLLSGYGCPQTAATTAASPVATAIVAQTGDKAIPPGGTPLIPGDLVSALKFSGTPAQGNAQVVPVTGQPFDKAIRLTATVRTSTPYDIQADMPGGGTIKAGDVLLVSFAVRCIDGQKETGEARTQFVFEKQGDPWTKFVESEVSAGKEWKRYYLPFQMREDGPASGTHVSFRLGYGPQTFEIADLQIANYGGAVKLADLPRTRMTYQGIEANAAWRKAAEARIEKIRKGDVTIIVKDASGKLVPNAHLALRMQRHAFAFGSAVSNDMIRREGPDGDKYRAWVTQYCSKVVIENDLKWGNFEGDPKAAANVVDWLNTHNIPVKGHNLVWPSWQNSPQDLKSLAGDKAALAKRVDDHIVSEVTALKGKVVEWDVINEPFANHDIMDVLGNDAMVHWFQLTHATDPKPRLLLNDYPPLDGSATANDHLNHFYKTLQFLQDKKAPIAGLGFQCHFGGSMIPPENLLSGLDRFAKLGMPISITEFDMNTNDDELKSAYMRDFMTATFSHPAVDTILMWGFWEGAHWLPDAALYSRDWTLRPHGKVYQDLITKTWWTNADGETDTKGTYKTRGFYGDYQLTITSPSNLAAKKTVPIIITKGGKNMIVVTL